MADSAYVVDVTGDSFQSVVIEGSRKQPVLVDFWASWCGPCQMLTPVLTQLADQYGGKFVLAKVNTEAEQQLATQFGIRGIPMCKLFKDGEPVDEFTGALPEGEVRAFLDRHIPRESDRAVAQARELWVAGDTAGALRLAEEAVTRDPDNTRVLLALARMQAESGDVGGAGQTLERLPANEQLSDEVKALRSHLAFETTARNAPPRAELQAMLDADDSNSEARFQLAARLVADNDAEGALEQLLLLLQKDRAYGDDAARKAMVQIFDMLGDDPMLARYRGRMMNLLY